MLIEKPNLYSLVVSPTWNKTLPPKPKTPLRADHKEIGRKKKYALST
jgi:hypothetical protein